jgi:hypothetical protein
MDRDYNTLQVINEISYLLTSFHLIVFTDYNPDVEAKLLAGWSMIFFSIANLVWPNLIILVRGMWPEIKEALASKKETKEEIEEEEMSSEFFENKRQ